MPALWEILYLWSGYLAVCTMNAQPSDCEQKAMLAPVISEKLKNEKSALMDMVEDTTFLISSKSPTVGRHIPHVQ